MGEAIAPSGQIPRKAVLRVPFAVGSSFPECLDKMWEQLHLVRLDHRCCALNKRYNGGCCAFWRVLGLSMSQILTSLRSWSMMSFQSKLGQTVCIKEWRKRRISKNQLSPGCFQCCLLGQKTLLGFSSLSVSATWTDFEQQLMAVKEVIHCQLISWNDRYL